VSALERWRRELAGWAIPDEILGEVPERYRTLVRLMARIGLRPGEAFTLTVG